MSQQKDIVERLDELRGLDHALPLRLREAAEFLRLLGRSNDVDVRLCCNNCAAICMDAAHIIESSAEACFYARETISQLRRSERKRND
jgi:hypothetical protein